jgi:hypothetical protein
MVPISALFHLCILHVFICCRRRREESLINGVRHTRILASNELVRDSLRRLLQCFTPRLLLAVGRLDVSAEQQEQSQAVQNAQGKRPARAAPKIIRCTTSRPSSASKLEWYGLPGPAGTVKCENQLHVGKAGFGNESHRPGDKPEIVSFLRSFRPFFQRLEILTRWRVS